MVEKKIPVGEEAIIYSTDAEIIADAIYAGLSEIAKAIREHTSSEQAEDWGEPVEPKCYMDGTPIE